MDIWSNLVFLSVFCDVLRPTAKNKRRTIYSPGRIRVWTILNIEQKNCYDWRKNESRSWLVGYHTFHCFLSFLGLSTRSSVRTLLDELFLDSTWKTASIGTTYPRTFRHFYCFWHPFCAAELFAKNTSFMGFCSKCTLSSGQIWWNFVWHYISCRPRKMQSF